MSVTVETPVSSLPLPLPAHFSHAEQSFSLKKRRLPFSSSSGSPCSSPSRLSHSLPPLPPSKGCNSVSRFFPQHQSPWTPLSTSLAKSPPPDSVYDPQKQPSFFRQCFSDLGLLGRGSFGEVYKVRSNIDGLLYAVKRSAQRFRGNSERNRCVREARNHEQLCPHPHILDFVAAWEERGRLYIQTELCSTSLLLHAENKRPGPDEAAAWAYLCDLLSALHHLHSRGFVHLDLKPANVLITNSGRLKLGDFGLLLQLQQTNMEEKKMEEAQEGDPRYMAPELLSGIYGPAADVFSLGVSILELACSIEVPNGGDGWQKLRRGFLPSEFTNSLSHELQAVLRMMLAPEPSQRPTVSELLAFPSVRKQRWKRIIYLTIAEAMLTLTSLCQKVYCVGCRLLSFCMSFLPWGSKPVPCTPSKESCDRDLTLSVSCLLTDSESPEDDAVFLPPTDPEISPTFLHRVRSVESTSTPRPLSPSVVHTPTHSSVGDWSSSHLASTPSSIHSKGSCLTLTPSGSPLHHRSAHGSRRSLHLSSTTSSNPLTLRWMEKGDDVTRSTLEPKNLLSLFEETSLQGEL
ncbi:membrane-associated tyrosine- and threonine-specific cdc2-inhibitory kinase isoform X2 [Gouania willdenowi]|uniref:non-specific serine/threonine protein kinase n=1 Tax=Gouania willdenowi TaxID=441366 RepID=A0A8C5HUK1_GOUWI|nr:membrane-associated tyrosine- and threonine-specific cdc2-inhibitory kinase isoform X2 [Gouania willdenowi]